MTKTIDPIEIALPTRSWDDFFSRLLNYLAFKPGIDVAFPEPHGPLEFQIRDIAAPHPLIERDFADFEEIHQLPAR